MKKFGLLSLVLILVMSLLTGCGGGEPAEDAKDETITLRLGHMAPESGNYHAFAVKFKELVEEETNGKVKIQIYSAGQLGYDRELLESMQFGNLDLGVITTSPMVNFVKEMAVLDVPFAFKDWDHVERFLSSDAAAELLDEGLDEGLAGLSIMPRGFRSTTNSKHPIEKPEDFKDIKLRVIESPLYVKAFEDIGATIQAMSWGEVFTALQQGTIDGIELDHRTLYDERVYEVQDYLTETEHIFAFCALVASKANLEALPEDVQNVLRTAAVEAAQVVGAEQRVLVDEYKQKLADEGIEFNNIDRDVLREMTKNTREWFVSEYGDKYYKVVEELR